METQTASPDKAEQLQELVKLMDELAESLDGASLIIEESLQEPGFDRNAQAKLFALNDVVQACVARADKASELLGDL